MIDDYSRRFFVLPPSTTGTGLIRGQRYLPLTNLRLTDFYQMSRIILKNVLWPDKPIMFQLVRLAKMSYNFNHCLNYNNSGLSMIGNS